MLVCSLDYYYFLNYAEATHHSKYGLGTSSMGVAWKLVQFSSVTQSCLALCNPMYYSLPGSPVHGISQARILEWVAISFSKGSSTPRDGIWVSCIVDRLFTIWATTFVFYLFANNILPNLRIIKKFGSLTSSSYTGKRLIFVKHFLLLTPLYIHYLLALNVCVSD